MAAKYNSVIVIVFMVVMMIMAMEKVDGETSAECRDRCSQSCAMTGALPAKCLQSCYSRCQGLPSQTIVCMFPSSTTTTLSSSVKEYCCNFTKAISIVLPEDRLSTKS
ncbi:hypothetical protein IGI04_036469 [Brassica rapa subsp. trilocularis]|uniref:Plant thionin family protein n=1 Tax=Brassica rapa subsp. trilocularis TaxID=1813537 RepID=A0ABQ7LEM9_BRACM|nr:hypothetical protein IGI04_036469 [Brassica rapa subsp. trilocularis]